MATNSLLNMKDVTGLAHATSRQCIQNHVIIAKILTTSKFHSVTPPIIPPVCLLCKEILKVSQWLQWSSPSDYIEVIDDSQQNLQTISPNQNKSYSTEDSFDYSKTLLLSQTNTSNFEAPANYSCRTELSIILKLIPCQRSLIDLFSKILTLAHASTYWSK